MSELDLIALITQTAREWADEEAMSNHLSNQEEKNRYCEMMADIGKTLIDLSHVDYVGSISRGDKHKC